MSSGAVHPTWVPFRSTVVAEERLRFSLRLMDGGCSPGGFVSPGSWGHPGSHIYPMGVTAHLRGPTLLGSPQSDPIPWDLHSRRVEQREALQWFPPWGQPPLPGRCHLGGPRAPATLRGPVRGHRHPRQELVPSLRLHRPGRVRPGSGAGRGIPDCCGESRVSLSPSPDAWWTAGQRTPAQPSCPRGPGRSRCGSWWMPSNLPETWGIW